MPVVAARSAAEVAAKRKDSSLMRFARLMALAYAAAAALLHDKG